jgi:hypothetical protein
MIRLRDAMVLAGTKLRTRKVRTIVTAVLASLLFAGLVFSFTVVKGAIDSYTRYSKNGLSQRYIANVIFYNTGSSPDMSSAELIVRAKERNKQVIADKKADAKRLGIEYDAANEAAVTFSDGGNGGSEYLNGDNFAVQQILKEEFAKKKTKEEITREIAAHYNPKQFYAAKTFGDTNNLTTMKLGKESFDSSTQQTIMYTVDPLTTLSYLPRTLVNSFLLDNADFRVATTTDSAIPVIVTYADAEKALGLTSLPRTASDKARLQRINEVKQQAANKEITVCYRNAASKQLIEQTKQQIAEIEKRASDKTYQRPSQLYALPDPTSCGPVIVTKDTRSAEEKRLAAKQTEFNLKYNLEQEPVQKKLTFRIVGLSPDTPNYSSMSTFESLASMVGGTSLMGQWIIPSELVDTSVQTAFIPQLTESAMSSFSYSNVGNLVEFSTATDAKKFVTEQACTGMDCMTKPTIAYFGSNSVLLQSVAEGAANVLWVAGLIVAGVAAVLMMGMVGRVITDSRRETAVFRAIGAKRNDIRMIYALYVLAFSLIIALSALVIGTALAWIYSMSTSDSLTTSAHLMFIESRETAPFILVGFWQTAVLLTIGVVVLAGFVSTLLPLGRNLARSPLKDMRDE